MHSECLAAIASTLCSIQTCLTQEVSNKEYITYDFLFWMNGALSATLRIHKFHFILLLPWLNLCSPRILLTSVPLSVVKGIWCPETDEDYHMNKMMDLGHSASS